MVCEFCDNDKFIELRIKEYRNWLVGKNGVKKKWCQVYFCCDTIFISKIFRSRGVNRSNDKIDYLRSNNLLLLS